MIITDSHEANEMRTYEFSFNFISIVFMYRNLNFSFLDMTGLYIVYPLCFTLIVTSFRNKK